MYELGEVKSILQAVCEQAEQIRSTNCHLGSVWRSIGFLKFILSEEVRRKLNLSADVEINTKNLMGMSDIMTLDIAYTAALLFQISHRFFVRRTFAQREHAVAAISDNPLRGTTDEYPARKRRATTTHPAANDAVKDALAYNNPYSDDRLFASSVPKILSTLPPPSIRIGFDFSSRIDVVRAEGFVFLACYFDPAVNRLEEPFVNGTCAVINLLQRVIPAEGSSSGSSESGEVDANDSISSRYARRLSSASQQHEPSLLDRQMRAFSETRFAAPDGGPAAFWFSDEGRTRFSEFYRFAGLISSTPSGSADVERIFR